MSRADSAHITFIDPEETAALAGRITDYANAITNAAATHVRSGDFVAGGIATSRFGGFGFVAGSGMAKSRLGALFACGMARSSSGAFVAGGIAPVTRGTRTWIRLYDMSPKPMIAAAINHFQKLFMRHLKQVRKFPSRSCNAVRLSRWS